MFKRRKRHKHNWSKWTTAQLEIIRMKDGQKIPYIGQTRVCEGDEGCGLREYD
jgi:hypothetical protein